MKNLLSFLFIILASFGLHAQNLVGAWEKTSTTKNGDALKTIDIYTDGFYASTTYDMDGKFVSTTGGSWKWEDQNITKTVEFHSEKPELVGTTTSTQIELKDGAMRFTDSNITYKRVDDGKPGELEGAWLMSGRVRNGETQQRDTTQPRKTMKILSGTRFQWIAYNTETKQFMGTGGGTYTTVDNTYTENIEFFSKDDSKTGRSLKFNFELLDGNWQHTGNSSKGDPIHEIWSPRTR